MFVFRQLQRAENPPRGLRIFVKDAHLQNFLSFLKKTLDFPGGGSALFEKPLISGEELQNITGQLLASGADIVEMNTIRKRLSGVKGGHFAQACAPAKVFSIVLSDILGDPLDMIASGPAVPDTSTCEQALAIAEKYHLTLSSAAKDLLQQETPKALGNEIGRAHV